MKIQLQHFSFFAFLSIYSSILLTYPVLVMLKRTDISFTPYIFLVNAAVYLIFVLKNIRLSGVRLILFNLILFGASLVSIMANMQYLDMFNLQYVRGYVTYSLWLMMIVSLKNYIDLDRYQKIFSVALLFLGFVNFLAVVAQSYYWRLPNNVDITRSPWDVVGAFVRAGSFYSDSNFLAINLVILFYSILASVKRWLFVRNFILVLLITSILLTFSRSALLALLFTLFIYSNRKINDRRQKVMFILVAFIIGFVGVGVTLGMDIQFFERFYSAFGVDSAYSRIRQYTLLMDFILEHPWAVIWGIGPGVFNSLYREEVHNFYFSFFSEFGLFGTTLLALLFVSYYKSNKNMALHALLSFWLIVSFVLPSIANPLFIILVLVTVLNNGQSLLKTEV